MAFKHGRRETEVKANRRAFLYEALNIKEMFIARVVNFSFRTVSYMKALCNVILITLS